ncbi:MAG: para-nitrobenzyl esterase [Pseudonocardiales bacterium]|nr:para-nitrobenzyl esterase [Pseudonocardiales bacterium]
MTTPDTISAGQSPVVATSGGRVRGEIVGGIARFRAIPYAAPPVGALRFAPPARPSSWDGVRDARSPGATAPQTHRSLPGVDLTPVTGPGWRRGEDYLTLDVWSPDIGAGGLPVIVFLHGGAFVAGTGSAASCDGSGFARAGTVLVTINYRVGAEGFLPVPGGATNIGLRDQIAAVEWVRENAEAFGGDPHNITLFGHSAGAASVACLLRSPLAEGLFRRAIVHSGNDETTRPLAVGHRLSAAVAEAVGVENTAEALRAVSSEQLLEAQAVVTTRGTRPDLRDSEGFDPGYGLVTFLPVTGDDVLPWDTASGAASAGWAPELLIGTCHDEINVYLVPTGVVDSVGERQAVGMLQASRPDAEAVLAAYGLGEGDSQPGSVLARALTDLAFRSPARRLARRHPGHTYSFDFRWPSPLHQGRLGACHGLELPFVFDTLGTAGGPTGLVGDTPPTQISALMQQAWVEFAASGKASWPLYGPDHQVLQIDETTSVGTDETAPISSP